MFKNHLKLALRRLRKEKLYSFVNVFGLTIGLTAFLLISLYVRDELSYDKFHANADQIYLLTNYDDVRDSRGSKVPADFVEYVERGVPEVEAFVRITDPSWKSIDLIQSNASDFYTERMFYADENFFEFFDFEVIDGNRKAILAELGSVVLTESFALKLFNRLDVIGEELVFNKEEKFHISGICQDPPGISSLKFDLIARAPKHIFQDKFSSEGRMTLATSFVKLPKQVNLESILTPINDEIRSIPAYFEVWENVKYQLERLPDIRMKSGITSNEFQTTDPQSVLVFSLIALVILLLAIINYVNLVTAQSVKRVKEIGLRKVIGAGSIHLLKYQLLESILISIISLILSFGITERLIPLFNAYLGKDITLNYFSLDFFLWVIVVGVALGLISGLYPAYYITRVRPLSLMNKSVESSGGRGVFRKALVLFQFTASGIIVLVLLVMSRQMNFVDQQTMGFDKDNLVTIPLYVDDQADLRKLKGDILQIKGVQSASLNTWRFGGMNSKGFYNKAFVKGEDGFIEAWFNYVGADEDFINTLSLNLVSTSGKFKNGELSEDQVIISESVVKAFGWGEDALEKRIHMYGKNSKEVVAIAADFHSYSLKEEIQPMVIEKYDYNDPERLTLRIDAITREQTMSEIEEVYTALTDRPLSYHYLNDQVERYYATEKNQFQLFQIFSGLAVFVSLLGLIAMTIYMAAQRRKEVSIRKILGASIRGLIFMLNREFTILVVLSFLIATPIAYYSMQDWLTEFVYRIEISPMIFVGALAAFLLMSWLVTIGQSLKVSNENPADVLREE